ncbi:MAG: ATP-grasp domain-containing protein [Bacteroidales bacterium]|nr:ATP-grasp domain-containing protein [Bacteroidales bacterium]MCF8458225.1 ATP-grasp domain-containing protein [Bacteroidales bacterium]
MKNILILINQLSETPTADEQDVLDQAQLVEDTLIGLGYKTSRAFMGLDLAKARQDILASGADVIFNLVESVDNKAEWIHLAPALLHGMRIPFTGSGAEAMILTSNKAMSKKFMDAHGMATPKWFSSKDCSQVKPEVKYIAKPLYEDASVGIDDQSIFFGHETMKLEYFRQRFGHNFFVEEFIEGREFNISVFSGADGPIVLPPAEIIFSNFPEGKPKIVGYQAKWDESSFEYENTNRTFNFPDSDHTLLEKLRSISAQCWKLFDLRGYARVDFRVDKNGKPYVLEMNANPCISPDSGFYAATQKAGLQFSEVIENIINDCVL